MAPPLATAELPQSNASVHHPVATGAPAVTAARLYVHVPRTRPERSERPVKGSVACACFRFLFLFFSMETLSLIDSRRQRGR